MKLKNLALSIALSLIAATAFSQTTFGIRGGVNFQNLTGEDGAGNDFDNKIRTGFNAGVNAEIPIGVGFYVQPGLLYSLKGAKGDNDAKIGLSYLEVPINFVYKPELGDGKLILGFGPYVGYGLSGNYKTEHGVKGDVEFENDISTLQAASGNLYFKRFDAGANLLFGYEFSNKLSFQLNAGLGLVDITPDFNGNNTDANTKNTGFGISVGYRF